MHDSVQRIDRRGPSAAWCGIDRRTLIAAGALTLGAAALGRPAAAWGDDDTPTSSEKQAEADAVGQRITQLQQDLAKYAEDYYKALDLHDAAVQAVDDAQQRIDDANAQISDLQDNLAARARSMYRTGQTTFLDLMLGATTFQEFATNWDLLENINEGDAELVQQTKDLRDQVEADKVTLEEQEQEAADQAAEAQRVKEEAEQSIQDLEAERQKLDAEAQALLEKEQDEQRAAEAAAAAARVRSTYAYYVPSRPIPAQGSVVDYALSRIGCPYVWGAEGPDTFDCSGLVRWAYLQVGMSVPHQTEALYYAAAARLPVSEAQPGDVLWISYGDGWNGHVGIACNEGGTHYVHAPTFGALVRDTDALSWAGFTHALRFA